MQFADLLAPYRIAKEAPLARIHDCVDDPWRALASWREKLASEEHLGVTTGASEAAPSPTIFRANSARRSGHPYSR